MVNEYNKEIAKEILELKTIKLERAKLERERAENIRLKAERERLKEELNPKEPTGWDKFRSFMESRFN